MTSRIRIGLVGLGAIGSAVLKSFANAEAEVVAVLTRTHRPELRSGLSVTSFDNLLAANADVVLECAGQTAFRTLVPELLRRGRDVIGISVGALADARLEEEVREAACSGGASLSIASGAVIGLDGLAAARSIGIQTVKYCQRAPATSWIGHQLAPPDLAERSKHTVFEGTARDAAKLFPKNANVSASVALAGIGFDRTVVELVSDAGILRNIHELEANGEFGSMRTEVSAMSIGPGIRSSRLVAGSLVHAALRRSACIRL